jgi:ribonuclease HI
LVWKESKFKGKRNVWIQTNEEGQPTLEKGLVPMRYSMNEGAKVYSAHPSNLGLVAPKAAKEKTVSPKAQEPTDDRMPIASGTQRESVTLPDCLVEYPPPPSGTIEIFTDGACTGNPGPSGYGLLIRHGETYREVWQFIGHGTNNIAELMAIKVALECVEERETPVRLHTDSAYSIGVLTKKWKPKANRALIAATKEVLSAFANVELVKVKGHAGHPLNERVDQLAVLAVKESNKQDIDQDWESQS